MTSTLAYSKGEIDRAGKVLLRALKRAEPLPSTDELQAATAVAETFRRAHRTPMIGARMGLRSCIDTEGLAVVELTQRLKRMPTVVDKLRRLPTLKLSSLQDLGGCRAVFATQAEVALAQQRFMSNSMRRNGTEDTVRDYVARPRDSGYRALHLWTRYRGLRIEVQLRTRLQHSWAATVEDLSALTGIDYKSGEGPEEVHVWLRLLSQSYAYAEAGVRPGGRFELELADANAAALSRIVRGAIRQESSHG